MDTKQAYNYWAEQYDTNDNKTRDLEAIALREKLLHLTFDRCLEMGCGTGKNTEWLNEKANFVTAVDFSEEMLSKAQDKISSNTVEFVRADITKGWNFHTRYDLITFSLVLEHVEDLDHIFSQISNYLNRNGHVYIGELHPFKQYMGSKARFETSEGVHIVNCYNHNISDFTQAAKRHSLTIVDVDEYFDNNDQTSIPRIFTLLLRKDR